MSIPSAHTGKAHGVFLSREKQEAMDAPLAALTQMSGGDLRTLLFGFFSFLHRRTDFYVIPNQADVEAGLPLKMGFREGDAEKLLLAAFRQFPLRRAPPQVRMEGVAAAGVQRQKHGHPEIESKPKSKEPAAESSEKLTTKDPDSKKVAGITEAKQKPEQGQVRYTEKGKQIPEGNGGSTKRYKWTQTLEETSVLIGVPEGVKGRDLDVSIQATSLTVRLKKPLSGENTPRVLVEGDLVEKIKRNESIWSMEGGVLVVTLEKVQRTWWETVIVGDEKIDTTLVDSSRKIDTYDESTQAAIRKIMFDQRQEQLGLPKSDEIIREKAGIPALPPGVEFIDKATLDAQGKND